MVDASEILVVESSLGINFYPAESVEEMVERADKLDDEDIERYDAVGTLDEYVEMVEEHLNTLEDDPQGVIAADAPL